MVFGKKDSNVKEMLSTITTKVSRAGTAVMPNAARGVRHTVSKERWNSMQSVRLAVLGSIRVGGIWV